MGHLFPGQRVCRIAAGPGPNHDFTMGRDGKAMMAVVQRKIIKLIAKVVPSLADRGRVGFDDQAMQAASLVRQISRREINLIVADGDCFCVRVGSGVGDSVFHGKQRAEGGRRRAVLD